MILLTPPINGEKVDAAMAASARGQAALVAGDTLVAQEQFELAGERFEEQLVTLSKAADFQLIRFLAATNYYKGGHYLRAKRICKEIQDFFLPVETRPIFAQFLVDVNDRSDSQYFQRINRQLIQLMRRGEYDTLLATLQDHQFVISRGDMASIRAECCEHLKDYRAAALFLADALQWKPDDPSIMVASATLPFSILAQDPSDPSEAWKAVEQLLDVLPNPMTHAGATCVKYFQVRGASAEVDQRRYSAELVPHFEKSWNGFQELSTQFKTDFEMRELMTSACYAAVYAYEHIFFDREKAREIRDRTIGFNPTSSLHSIFLSSDVDALSKQFSENSRSRMGRLLDSGRSSPGITTANA